MGSFEDRVFRKIRQDGDDPLESCWIWLGGLSGDGYGTISSYGAAHRAVYEILIGEIPKGLELDHLCRVRNCVNPWHLDPVTHQVNIQRAWASRGGMCAKGLHSMDDAIYPPSGGKRRCRHCRRASARRATEAYRERRRDGERVAA